MSKFQVPQFARGTIVNALNNMTKGSVGEIGDSYVVSENGVQYLPVYDVRTAVGKLFVVFENDLVPASEAEVKAFHKDRKVWQATAEAMSLAATKEATKESRKVARASKATEVKAEAVKVPTKRKAVKASEEKVKTATPTKKAVRGLAKVKAENPGREFAKRIGNGARAQEKKVAQKSGPKRKSA